MAQAKGYRTSTSTYSQVLDALCGHTRVISTMAVVEVPTGGPDYTQHGFHGAGHNMFHLCHTENDYCRISRNQSCPYLLVNALV